MCTVSQSHRSARAHKSTLVRQNKRESDRTTRERGEARMWSNCKWKRRNKTGFTRRGLNESVESKGEPQWWFHCVPRWANNSLHVSVSHSVGKRERETAKAWVRERESKRRDSGWPQFRSRQDGRRHYYRHYVSLSLVLSLTIFFLSRRFCLLLFASILRREPPPPSPPLASK